MGKLANALRKFERKIVFLELLYFGPSRHTLGICGNIEPKHWNFLYTASQSWEHYSGNPSYPIPGQGVVYVTSRREKVEIPHRNWFLRILGMKQTTTGLWYGKQLEYRNGLLRHILKEITKEEAESK